MSFAQTRSGAGFIAVWGMRTSSMQLRMGLQHPDLTPFKLFTVTDDRGTRYDLDFAPGGGPEWSSEVSLRPTPPPGIRWLDVAAPLRPAVRVEVNQAPSPASTAPANTGPANVAPEVSEAKLSPGEHLLNRLAEQLLTIAPEFRRHRPLAAASLGPRAWAAGLGDIVAALEAAGVLPPLSPGPARLAAVCAGMGITGHGIADLADARDLPETWLSLIAHYHRRKPDAAPVRDGYAAAAAALPELDGIRLALLGLHNSEGRSSLHMLARGVAPEGHHGPFGPDVDFPLSVWLRDSGGRWHAARAVGWRWAGCEHALLLQLVPPLPRSTAWIEVQASGRSGEVRTRLPLRWGSPS